MQTSHASHSPVVMATRTLMKEEVPWSHSRPDGGAALLLCLLTPLLRMLTQSSYVRPRLGLCAMRAGWEGKLRTVGNGAVQHTEAGAASGLTQAGLVQDAVALPQRQRGQSSLTLLTANNLGKVTDTAVTGGAARRLEPHFLSALLLP